jgi:hypothetical protein
MWIELRNVSSKKKEETQSLKLLTCRELNPCILRAFRKSVQTCVTLLPNACPALPCRACLQVNFWLNEMTVLSQPPHQPDVAPCEFFLSPKLRIALKGAKVNDNKKNCGTTYKLSNIARHEVVWTAARWMGLPKETIRSGQHWLNVLLLWRHRYNSKLFGGTALISVPISLLFMIFVRTSCMYLHGNYYLHFYLLILLRFFYSSQIIILKFMKLFCSSHPMDYHLLGGSLIVGKPL